jgi:hypothetical protein
MSVKLMSHLQHTECYTDVTQGSSCGRERAKPVAEVLPHFRKKSNLSELLTPVMLRDRIRAYEVDKRLRKFKPA